MYAFAFVRSRLVYCVYLNTFNIIRCLCFTYQINPNRITLPSPHCIKVSSGNRTTVQPMRIARDFSGRVHRAHVDDVGVLAQGRPFGLDDALEVL
jgi:hypothetical protein